MAYTPENPASTYTKYGAPINDSTTLVNIKNGLSDIDMLARIIYAEESNLEGQKGVAQVISNRRRETYGYFPVCEFRHVIYQSGQFTTLSGSNARANRPKRGDDDWKSAVDLAIRLTNYTVIPFASSTNKVTNQMYFLAGSNTSGKYDAKVIGGSVFYNRSNTAGNSVTSIALNGVGYSNPANIIWQWGSKGSIVKAIQFRLYGNGYLSISGIDSNFGSGTETAVASLQATYNITSDGKIGSTTWAKFFPTITSSSSGQSLAIKAMQTILNYRNYSVGTPDGIWGSKTTTALNNYKTANGLPANSTCDWNTWAKLGK